jgi:AAA+ ATPase superfamily predicted ATPase
MKDIFINRDVELKQIETLLDDRTNRVAIILGEGGIGKTRFLEEIVKRVSYKDNCMLFLELDFDEYLPQQTIGYFNQKILNSVRLINPRLLEVYDLDLVIESPEFFTHLVNRSTEQRKVFIFDTVEKLRNRPLKRQLFSYLGNINNAVFIFAGRDATEDEQYEFDDFEEQARQLDGSYVRPIHLDRFSSENAKEYLKAKQYLVGIDIEEELADQIIKLTEGVPILIDLSVDYVVREISLEPLFDKDAGNFKKELVQYIKQLATPLDLLILILALISPLSVESAADILGINEAEAKTLFRLTKIDLQ